MGELYNIYCDESCHLQNDQSKVMVLGAVWCPAAATRSLADKVRAVKARHGLAERAEVKWTKVSPAKLAFYLDLADLFFAESDLHFRGILIPDKSKLDHAKFKQTHDEWYYKMSFRLLEPIIDPEHAYCVYLDIKDTRSEDKRARLEKVLRSSRYDRSERIIRRVQQIRSHESEILQLADLLIGAIGHHNRGVPGSKAKAAVIERVRERSGKLLDQSSWLRERKFNLFRWTPEGG
ncbi:MAG: DUF3800 domain-containing protein [Gemmataceae bacterium]|nr:DUF3800 domain-containing protein [Gemmataceae bacterium]